MACVRWVAIDGLRSDLLADALGGSHSVSNLRTGTGSNGAARSGPRGAQPTVSLFPMDSGREGGYDGDEDIREESGAN